MAVTNLVVNLLRGLGESNSLLKGVADLVQLLALGPVVEGSGNVDLLGRVSPMRDGSVSNVSV